MGNLILECGQKVNILERMASDPVASPAASSNFPATNLYAPALSSSLFIFGSSTSNPNITFDLNAILDGGFETALSSATNWTNISAGAGNVFARTSGTPSPFVGSWSGKATLVTSGTSLGNYSAGRQVISARTGENRTFTCAIITDAAARTGKVELYNTKTGNYLTSSGGWTSTQTYVFSSTASSWVTKSINYTVESQAVCNADLAPLRYTLLGSAAAGYVAFDEVYDWPWVDFVSLHGFLNLEPVVSVQIHSSTDNFASGDTTRATMTAPDNSLMNPAFFTTFTQEGDRYLRLLFSGQPTGSPSNIYGGTVIAAQQVLPARMQDYGWNTQWNWTQVRSSVRAFLIDDSATRTVMFSFKYPSAVNFAEARDLLFGRSALGAYPLVVVPFDTDDLVIYGRIDPTWQAQRTLTVEWEQATVKIVELPNPNVTNV